MQDASLDWNLFKQAKSLLWDRVKLQRLRPLKRPIRVSIVDSGFDLSHPFLKQRLLHKEGWNAESETHSLDEAESIEAFFGSTEERVSSHGTHIAGIIAQLVSEELGIIPIRVGSSDSWVLNPMQDKDWMVINGRHRMRMPFDKAFEELIRSDSRVVNLSWRLDFQDPYMVELLIGLAESEKLIVIAAGNSAEIVGEDPSTEGLAAITQHPRVRGRILLVGATAASKKGETPAHFSSRPAPELEPYFIWTAGEAILSTAPLQNAPRGFEFKSGTSMAAGVVTAALGQLLGEAPINVDQAKALVCTSTSPLQSAPGILAGCGLLNMQKALDAAQRYDASNANGPESFSKNPDFRGYLPPGGFA